VLSASYAPTRYLAFEGAVPLRAALTLARFLEGDRKPLPGYESIHHRNQVLFGPADPLLLLRLTPLSGEGGLGPVVSFALGTSFPVGHLEPNPYQLARRGIPHEHMFFGAGVVEPQARLDVGWGFPWLRVGASAEAAGPLGENRLGYRPPYRGSSSLFVDSSFGLSWLTVRGGGEIYAETPALWSGEPAENSGRIDGVLLLGAFVRPRSTFETYALVRVTPLTLALGGQLISPMLLVVGASFDIPRRR
jgi:hypothetical protein